MLIYRYLHITVIMLSVFGWRVAQVGGNLNNGSKAGLSYFNVNNDSSNDNSNIGAQLSIVKKQQSVITTALAEKYESLSGVSRLRTLRTNNADMKRYTNLFEKVCDRENITLAFHNARKGKSSYPEVKRINKDPEKYINKLQDMLVNQKFRNSEYDVFKRETGGKQRIIYRLPFYPDRIIHHCIVQVMMPIWMNLLIRDTFSTIPGRGIHDGANRIKESLRDRVNTRYCLKLDVAKYYPSIDHEILKAILRKKINDENMMHLMSEIIDSAPGIPIGNYVSQWFGNIYLAYFDHFVKEDLRMKYYFRYADDLVILHNDKAVLHHVRSEIREYLRTNLNLDVKGNYQIFPVNVRGIDFLGYRFYHTHTLVRKRIVKEFKRKIKSKPATKQTQSAYWGWFKHANTYNLRKKYFKDETI